MKVITLEQLLQLHVLAIQLFGGSDGLRDLGRLEAATPELADDFLEKLAA